MPNTQDYFLWQVEYKNVKTITQSDEIFAFSNISPDLVEYIRLIPNKEKTDNTFTTTYEIRLPENSKPIFRRGFKCNFSGEETVKFYIIGYSFFENIDLPEKEVCLIIDVEVGKLWLQ